jgi:hypothetical protein
MTMIAWRSSLDAPCWEQSFDDDRDFHLSRSPALGDPPYEAQDHGLNCRCRTCWIKSIDKESCLP